VPRLEGNCPPCVQPPPPHAQPLSHSANSLSVINAPGRVIYAPRGAVSKGRPLPWFGTFSTSQSASSRIVISGPGAAIFGPGFSLGTFATSQSAKRTGPPLNLRAEDRNNERSQGYDLPLEADAGRDYVGLGLGDLASGLVLHGEPDCVGLALTGARSVRCQLHGVRDDDVLSVARRHDDAQTGDWRGRGE
jgi:hypothetical protein